MKKQAPLIGMNMDFIPDENWIDIKRDKYFVISQYVDRIVENGGIPILLPCAKDYKLIKKYIDKLDGFLFTGGADYPPEFYGEKECSEKVNLMHSRRYENDMLIAKYVMNQKFPVLGICAGMQLVSIISGGKLIQDIEFSKKHTNGAFHQIAIDGGKILTSIFSEKNIEVNSFHHQAVVPQYIGKDFVISAKAFDGTVEAIESISERFVLCVQWHPERMPKFHGDKVLKTFINKCIENMK